jgi:excinuclease ABC subunit C
LRGIPAVPGVFALWGEREPGGAPAEPYLTRAADLRRRMTRLLAPPESQSKRLNLRERVRWIEYCVTGSAFESLLTVYDAAEAIFGAAEARRRLRLHTPYCLRMTVENAHPRVYSTNRLSKRGLINTYGPFPSRAAAERYCDAVLDLFKLRRCYEDLEVSLSHPGCAYGEMKKCMAPCNTSCTAEEYAAEATAVEAFFNTHGESMLAGISAERERASAEMEFEQAAALHGQYTKVKATAGLADELVRPVPKLRAVIVQAAAPRADSEDLQEAAVFLLEGGCILGPERLSTLGVRAVKEQTSVGSSLFAQPLMLQAVPLEEGVVSAVDSPEVRAERVLGVLAAKAGTVPDLARLGDHLSLLRRWYYRPEKQRAGEVFLPNADGSWPIRRILRGAARMALGEPKGMAETNREGVAAAKTKIIHEGREGVERVVPVLERVGRKRKSKAGAAPVEVPDALPE